MLRHWPVSAILSCSVNGVAIPAAAALAASAPIGVGFVFDGREQPPGRMQRLSLRGRRFTRGLRMSRSPIWQAIRSLVRQRWRRRGRPTASPRFWRPMEIGRAMAALLMPASSPLTPVAANPGAGQYSVGNGIYSFAAADAGAALSLTYGYVPADLAVACLGLVAERYAYRSRIGQQSKSAWRPGDDGLYRQERSGLRRERLAALSARCDAMIEAILDAGAVDRALLERADVLRAALEPQDSAKTIGRRTAGIPARSRIDPILGRG